MQHVKKLHALKVQQRLHCIGYHDSCSIHTKHMIADSWHTTTSLAQIVRNLAIMCACLQVLEAQGGKAVLPTDRAGLHPLLVPVCELGTAAGLPPSASSSGTVACLLRWPVPTLYKVSGCTCFSFLESAVCFLLLRSLLKPSQTTGLCPYEQQWVQNMGHPNFAQVPTPTV